MCWAFSWTESICTLYKTPESTSFIDQLHLFKVAAHSVALYAHILYAAYYLYLTTLWAFGWSENICTLYKTSESTSFIDQLHLCKGSAISAALQAYIQYKTFYLYLARF